MSTQYTTSAWGSIQMLLSRLKILTWSNIIFIISLHLQYFHILNIYNECIISQNICIVNITITNYSYTIYFKYLFSLVSASKCSLVFAWLLFLPSSKWWSEAQEKKRLAADPRDTKVKKKLRDVKLHPGFPNPAVAQAYLEPSVDQSDSSFSWGRPQVDMIKEYPLCVCVYMQMCICVYVYEVSWTNLLRSAWVVLAGAVGGRRRLFSLWSSSSTPSR